MGGCAEGVDRRQLGRVGRGMTTAVTALDSAARAEEIANVPFDTEAVNCGQPVTRLSVRAVARLGNEIDTLTSIVCWQLSW